MTYQEPTKQQLKKHIEKLRAEFAIEGGRMQQDIAELTRQNAILQGDLDRMTMVYEILGVAREIYVSDSAQQPDEVIARARRFCRTARQIFDARRAGKVDEFGERVEVKKGPVVDQPESD